MTNLSTLAAALLKARGAKERAEAALKVATAAVGEAEEALFDGMVEAGLPKITADGHNFSLDTKTYYSVSAENSEAFYAAMKALGREGIFKHTAHYQTLNATLRELCDQEGSLPEDVAALVTAFDKGKVAVRKAAKS